MGMRATDIANIGSNLKPAMQDGSPLLNGEITVTDVSAKLLDLIAAVEPRIRTAPWTHIMLRFYGTVNWRTDAEAAVAGHFLFWGAQNAPLIRKEMAEFITVTAGSDTTVAFAVMDH